MSDGAPATALRGGYDPRHYAQLAAVEDRHFWFTGRARAIEAVVVPLISSLPDGYRVLEVGCGTGHVLRMLQVVCEKGSVVGLDLLWDGLPYAQRRTSGRVVQASSTEAPFSVRFDLIGLFDVVEHIDDDCGFLRETAALLAPGGRLVVTVPAYRRLWSAVDESARHCRRYEEDELRARLEQSGYEVEYLTPFLASLYPLMRLSRLLSGWRGAGNPLRRELQIIPVVNPALDAVLALEARLGLRSRRRLPIGTSLLAVARAGRPA